MALIPAPAFTHCFVYDPGLSGITLPIALSMGEATVSFQANVDTGSTHCMFSRAHGERLGLDIEAGLPLRMLTVTGYFQTYRHELTLSVAGYSFDIGAYFAADAAFTRDVVGRNGFLDRVNLGRVDDEGKRYLGRYGDDAG